MEIDFYGRHTTDVYIQLHPNSIWIGSNSKRWTFCGHSTRLNQPTTNLDLDFIQSFMFCLISILKEYTKRYLILVPMPGFATGPSCDPRVYWMYAIKRSDLQLGPLVRKLFCKIPPWRRYVVLYVTFIKYFYYCYVLK